MHISPSQGSFTLNIELLGQCAAKCRAYAKALHYKEEEFLTKSATTEILESLIRYKLIILERHFSYLIKLKYQFELICYCWKTTFSASFFGYDSPFPEEIGARASVRTSALVCTSDCSSLFLNCTCCPRFVYPKCIVCCC